jgi:hypothetical protein
MRVTDSNAPTAVSALENPAPATASAISADIRAIETWSQRERELESIRGYLRNWDGRESDAPSAAAIDAAALFLNICKELDFMKAPARIALSPSGFVSVDWLFGDVLFRAEIQDNNEIEWMRATKGQAAEFFVTKLVDDTGFETEQVQTWQPAPVAEDELALAFAR